MKLPSWYSQRISHAQCRAPSKPREVQAVAAGGEMARKQGSRVILAGVFIVAISNSRNKAI